ncbi:hypothetical protein MVEN_00952500 [Mycena venus]|uniref:Uncharacterized protein n=1 Tax=Mycena venus TaxID=2733690 RepID=A0A8H6YD87_9AGAR|nr:hypothetical protein MVEN_00952500 [Mycena venus]
MAALRTHHRLLPLLLPPSSASSSASPLRRLQRLPPTPPPVTPPPSTPTTDPPSDPPTTTPNNPPNDPPTTSAPTDTATPPASTPDNQASAARAPGQSSAADGNTNNGNGDSESSGSQIKSGSTSRSPTSTGLAQTHPLTPPVLGIRLIQLPLHQRCSGSDSVAAASTKSTNIAPIIAGVLVPLFFLLLFGAVAFMAYKRRQKVRDRQEWERTHAEIADAVRNVGGPVSTPPVSWTRFDNNAAHSQADLAESGDAQPFFEPKH